MRPILAVICYNEGKSHQKEGSDMNIDQLNYFLSVAETGSINASAQKFFVSQQAVNASLKKLETEIDKNEGQQQSGILHAEAQQKDERVQDKADDADKPAPTDPDVVQQPADEDNHRDLDGVHDGNPPVGLAHISAEERLSPVQRDIRLCYP